MTPSDIGVEIAISATTGFVFLALGVLLKEPLTKFHRFVARPTPLNPKTRGQWTENLAAYEVSLERVNYLNSHPRDLYLYLLQLIFFVLFFFGASVVMFLFFYSSTAGRTRDLGFATGVVFLVGGMILATFGIVEGGRLSQKRIDATRAKLQKQVDRCREVLSQPKK